MGWLDSLKPISDWLITIAQVQAQAFPSNFGIAAAAAGFGILAAPKAGPGRAITIALRSRFLKRETPPSARVVNVAEIRSLLEVLKKDAYVVVNGPKGVGKTKAVKTAVDRMWGVLPSVDVAAGDSTDSIVEKVLAVLCRQHHKFFRCQPSAQRVLFFYNLVASKPPIVILNVIGRSEGEPYAQIPGAARALASLGLRVLVDASTNSIPPETLTTGRQRVVEFGPMDWNIVESIPEFKYLLDTLKDEGAVEVVHTIVGGVPSELERLQDAILFKKRSDPGSAKQVVDTFIRAKLITAIGHRDKLLKKDGFEEFLLRFKITNAVPEVNLGKLVLPSPSPVLREVHDPSQDLVVLQPADSAMAFVLRHNLKACPSMSSLKALM